MCFPDFHFFADFVIGGDRKIKELLLNGAIPWSWSIYGRLSSTDFFFSPSLFTFVIGVFVNVLLAWTPLSPNLNDLQHLAKLSHLVGGYSSLLAHTQRRPVLGFWAWNVNKTRNNHSTRGLPPVIKLADLQDLWAGMSNRKDFISFNGFDSRFIALHAMIWVFSLTKFT